MKIFRALHALNLFASPALHYIIVSFYRFNIWFLARFRDIYNFLTEIIYISKSRRFACTIPKLPFVCSIVLALAWLSTVGLPVSLVL